MPKQAPKRLVVATANPGKLREFQLAAPDFEVRPLPAKVPPPEENGATFEENAASKAEFYGQFVDGYLFADDSGLEVDALDGAPGVYSARFATLDSKHSGNAPDADNNAKLLRLLAKVPAAKRTARFRCVLALTPVVEFPSQNASPVCDANEFELQTELFDGTCEGRIGFAPSGHGGFGYDPLFIPDGQEQSFAELGEAVKNQLSHRANALAKLAQYLASSPKPQ